MAINTNISVSEREAQIYKRFKNLSVNAEVLPQGDGNIKISPFDDYVLFTLYDEIDGEDAPIDLSNVGTLYLSFIGENDEIRIPYYTNVEELNLSQGQVLFRITKENSKKILALDNNNFYVSSAMVSPDGAESDESVIYTGTFSSLTDAAMQSLTSQLDDARLEYSRELAKLQSENANLKSQTEELNQTVGELNSTIDTLNKSNLELSNEVDELTKEATSKKIEEIQRRSREAQAASDAAKNNVQKNLVLQGKSSARPVSRTSTNVAANNLKRYS
jgi:myosin heavy subunit